MHEDDAARTRDDDEARQRKEGKRDEGEADPRVEQARNHPVRAAILAMLPSDGEGVTVEEVRERLPEDRSLSLIAYHLKVLEQVNLARASSGTAPRYTLPA